MTDFPAYTPSVTFASTNALYGNHYKFAIDRLPDLSFFVHSVTLASVAASPITQSTPFVNVQQPGSRLQYGSLIVKYLIDAQFKNYFSLYYWLCGYGFPNSFDEVVQFRDQQQQQIGNLRPRPRNLETTFATLTVLTPDTNASVAQLRFSGVFPTDLSGLEFSTMDADAPLLIASCTFACDTFDIQLSTGR